MLPTPSARYKSLRQPRIAPPLQLFKSLTGTAKLGTMRTFYILIPEISSNQHRGPPRLKKLYKIMIHLQILTACNYFLLPIKDVLEQ